MKIANKVIVKIEEAKRLSPEALKLKNKISQLSSNIRKVQRRIVSDKKELKDMNTIYKDKSFLWDKDKKKTELEKIKKKKEFYLGYAEPGRKDIANWRAEKTKLKAELDKMRKAS